MNIMTDNKIIIPDWFSTNQAVSLTGMSKTMLDYLVRTEILVPSLSPKRTKRGRGRRYSFSDIVALRTLAKLLDAGVSVKRLKVSLKRLFKSHSEITPRKIPGKFLVTDGKDIYFWNKGKLLENLSIDGQLAFSFVMELKPIHNQVINIMASKKFKSIA